MRQQSSIQVERAADQGEGAQARTQADEKGAGGELFRSGLNKSKSLPDGFAGDKIIHAKATRYIAATYGLNLWGLELLGALVVYLDKEGRTGIGVNQSSFIDWTGARTNWIKRMNAGLVECLELGLIDRFPFNAGFCVDITHKGEQVLRAYERRGDEIREEIAQERGRKAQAAEDKRRARLNIRELGRLRAQ